LATCLLLGAAASATALGAATAATAQAEPASAGSPSGTVAPPAPEPSAEARAVVKERLSRAFAQRARNLLQTDRVFLGMLDSAESLLELSTELAPDNPYIWRVALDLATTMEDGDPTAVALSREALRRINELDPGNEMIRLRRILDAISDRQTAEERLAIYDQLLAPESVARIGNAVAARLAFDAAVLRRRTGDIEGFERELLHAIDLDSAFPEATELAAGYFRMRAPSAVEDARAMRLALIANPIRTPAALGLARLCLEKGAYRAAAEILDVEADILATPRPDPVFDGVLTDLVVALWGADRLDDAFGVLSKRQRMLDAALFEELGRSGTLLSVEERRKISMPVAPQLAATFAALSNARAVGDAKIAIENCAFSYETQLQSLERILKDPARPDVRARSSSSGSAATSRRPRSGSTRPPRPRRFPTTRGRGSRAGSSSARARRTRRRRSSSGSQRATCQRSSGSAWCSRTRATAVAQRASISTSCAPLRTPPWASGAATSFAASSGRGSRPSRARPRSSPPLRFPPSSSSSCATDRARSSCASPRASSRSGRGIRSSSTSS
jgi:hypothetical protein